MEYAKRRGGEESLARNFISRQEPFEEISIDAFGPMVPDRVTGHTYGLAAICNMSRFVIIRSAPDTTAESAARFLLDIGGTFGFPKGLRYDNSSQFANHLMTALTTLLGIERRPSVPFCPSSNGVIERGIKEILRHLKIIVNTRRNHDDWGSMLPFVARIMNAEKHAGIGVSPAEIIMPAVRLNRHLVPEKEEAFSQVGEGLEEIQDKKRKQDIKDWLHHLRALQAQTIKRATENQSVVQHRILSKQPEQTKEFKTGEWCTTTWRGGKPNKLSVTKRGPYLVTKKLSSTTYELQDPADLRTYTRHAREMTPYKLGHDEDPRDTIAMDEVENLVECVVDHNDRNSSKKSDWDFRVRWTGQPPEEDTWIPYMEARPLEAFDKYLREHPELAKFGMHPDASAKPVAARRPKRSRVH